MSLSSIHAAVLPEDRADILYHSYDGGGAEISGPSYLVRKKFSESVSASVNHYVDSVSSASIDVITRASPYTEERTENSLSVDYLHEKTLISVGITESIENDFDATTFSFGISQDMFGDLTTIGMSFALGDNIIGETGNDTFSEEATVRSYRFSLSQVMTKDLIMAFTLETITDEGFLNNPYRAIRYIDPLDPLNYIYDDEVYPNTRTSHAAAIRGKYYLPFRAALHGGFRVFSDDWGIEAQTYEIGYTWPYSEALTLEFNFRFYDQTKADFYSDLFPFPDAQNFLARDKEMSTFTSNTLGLGAHYKFIKNGSGFIKRGSVNFSWDYIQFDYEDFRDLTVAGVPPGQEPLYEQDANVIRAFVSIWF
ncbi:MAG: DUF3570 domain-containing protein [Gammaproteobacteria bacterium]|nr:DUF3570 domain-containing protein [Gammaproteobacteria bacterium]